MGYKLVIFDLDGTLLDTIEDLAEAVNHALRKRGLPLHGLEEYRGRVGVTVDEVLADFTGYYCTHIDVHTHPYPGMAELVEDLHAAGVRFGARSFLTRTGCSSGPSKRSTPRTLPSRYCNLMLFLTASA